jgi:phage gp36-like protein
MAQSQYATTSDLQNLAITPAAYGRFGATAATAALQAASGICDGYISSQFDLPLQVSPQGWDMSLTMYTTWIAAFLLYSQFGYSPMAPADEIIESRYKKAIEWLQQIKTQEITPPWVSDPSAVSRADAAGDWAITDDPVGFTSRGTVNNSSQPLDSSGAFFWW